MTLTQQSDQTSGACLFLHFAKQLLNALQASFDESKVTLGPNRGKSGWKSGSGSAATKTGSGSYGPSRDNTDGGSTPRFSTPTTMNRLLALTTSSAADTSPYNQRKVSSRCVTKSRCLVKINVDLLCFHVWPMIDSEAKCRP